MLAWWRPVLLGAVLLVSMGCGHGTLGGHSATSPSVHASHAAATPFAAPCHELPCCDSEYGCHCSMTLAKTTAIPAQESHDQQPWGEESRLPPAPRRDIGYALQAPSWITFLLPPPNPLLTQRTMLLC